MGYCLGHRLRDLQEAMALTLGEVLSLAACNRIVLSVTKHMEAFKKQPLASPPPIVLVDGMWVKIAYPTDEISEDSRGRRRSVKRKQKRVVLLHSAYGPMGTGKLCIGRLRRAKRLTPGTRSLGHSM